MNIYLSIHIYLFIRSSIHLFTIIQKLEDAQRQLAAKQASLAEARAKLKEVKHFVCTLYICLSYCLSYCLSNCLSSVYLTVCLVSILLFILLSI